MPCLLTTTGMSPWEIYHRKACDGLPRRMLDLLWPRMHAHKHAHVEIDREREERLDIPAVPCRRCRERAEDEPERRFMRILCLCRRASVIRKTRPSSTSMPTFPPGGVLHTQRTNSPLFRIVATGEHGQIRTRHAQQAGILHGLNRRIDKGRGGAVGIQVDDVDAVAFGAVGVDQGAFKRSELRKRREGGGEE